VLKVSFQAYLRIHSSGHFQSSDRPKNRHANDRFQKNSCHRETVAGKRSFSKAVARAVTALLGIRFRRYVRSSISRTGSAEEWEPVAPGGSRHCRHLRSATTALIQRGITIARSLRGYPRRHDRAVLGNVRQEALT